MSYILKQEFIKKMTEKPEIYQVKMVKLIHLIKQFGLIKNK